MIPRPRVTGRIVRLVPLAVLAVSMFVLCPATASAQAKDFALRFSSKAGDTEPREIQKLRPNIVQDYFVYVENLNNKAGTLKALIQADGKTIDGGESQPITVKADQKFVQVAFGPKPAEKAPTPPPPPAPPMPPVFAEIKGPPNAIPPSPPRLSVVLVDAMNMPQDDAPLKIAQPKDYIEITKVRFYPNLGGDKKNQLRIEMKAKAKDFAGPRCRVDLVLHTGELIPGLVDSKKQGTRSGFLTGPNSVLVLTADNLDFKRMKEENGYVYLTVDGYERAFTFQTTFPFAGNESEPQLVYSPLIRLFYPKLANPGEPVKLKVEVDNLGEEVVEVGIDRDDDTKFSKLNGELEFIAGNRQLKMLINPAFPGGALQLKPEMSDWKKDWELADVVGKRNIQVRLLQDAVQVKVDEDDKRVLAPKFNTALVDGGEPDIKRSVVLDGTPPEGVKFVDDWPKSLPRGKSLPVSAVGKDPESGIKEVFFFVGKLTPEGKVPPNTNLIPGTELDKEKGLWGAVLDAPTENKGRFDVTVVFVNTAGMPASDTVKIELTDSGKGGKDGGGSASISGKLVDPAGRLQGKGILVELRDADGKVKDTTMTDDKSAYTFKDLAPGTYRVGGLRTANNTKGATVVQVKEAEKKVDVDVKMSR
jgi:hypothetical protein